MYGLVNDWLSYLFTHNKKINNIFLIYFFHLIYFDYKIEDVKDS